VRSLAVTVCGPAFVAVQTFALEQRRRVLRRCARLDAEAVGPLDQGLFPSVALTVEDGVVAHVRDFRGS